MSNISDLRDQVYKYFRNLGYRIIDISNDESVMDIHNCIFNNIVNDNGDDITYLYYGNYHYEKKMYDTMIKYYLMSIELGNAAAMHNLGYYYDTIKDNITAMKYYDMSAEHKNIEVIKWLQTKCNLCGDYDKMVKYSLMGFELGDMNSIKKLIGHYIINNDEENMLKYHNKLTELDDFSMLDDIISYYNEDNDDKCIEYCILKSKRTNTFQFQLSEKLKLNYDLFIKFYSENKEFAEGYCNQLCDIIMYHIDTKNVTKELLNIILDMDCSKNQYIGLIKKLLLEKIDLMDLHFSYSMEGKGFNDAKNDFLDRIAA